MILELNDWRFEVDKDATWAHTERNSLDHCDCGYCNNFYQALPLVYPELIAELSQFGVNYQGPSELMPFEPTYMLACYRVQGRILSFGSTRIHAGDAEITPETADDTSFFLWAGEVFLPWLQEEPMEDVVSPANLPEFLDRMEEVWLLRHGECPSYPELQ